MPNPEDAIHLHFSDLKLLMENYQNVVQLNTLLLEQQKQIIELQKELVKNQTNVTSSQAKVYDKIENMMKIIDSHTNNFEQSFKGLDAALHSRFDSLDSAMHSRFDSTVSKIEETKSSTDEMKLDMVKQHSGLSTKMYVGYVGAVLIIIALVGMVTTSYEKFKILEHVADAINQIKIFLKIP